VSGRVSKVSLQRFGRRSTLRVTVGEGASSIPAIFFNQLAPEAVRGRRGGRARGKGRRLPRAGPRLAEVGSPDRPRRDRVDEPVYPLAEGLGQDLVRRLCAEAARRSADLVRDPLDAADLELLGLPPLPRAIAEVHAPSSEESFRAPAAASPRAAPEAPNQVAARRASARSRARVVVDDLVHERSSAACRSG
jgi:RecG-like helicase